MSTFSKTTHYTPQIISLNISLSSRSVNLANHAVSGKRLSWDVYICLHSVSSCMGGGVSISAHTVWVQLAHV